MNNQKSQAERVVDILVQKIALLEKERAILLVENQLLQEEKEMEYADRTKPEE